MKIIDILKNPLYKRLTVQQRINVKKWFTDVPTRLQFADNSLIDLVIITE